MSSGAGLRSFPGAAAYSATKGAQRMFAEALRHELAGSGVSLTTVYPSEIATSLHDHEGHGALPAWYRGGEHAAPAAALATRIVKAVEHDSRDLYWKGSVRGMSLLQGLSPRARGRGAATAARQERRPSARLTRSVLHGRGREARAVAALASWLGRARGRRRRRARRRSSERSRRRCPRRR